MRKKIIVAEKLMKLKIAYIRVSTDKQAEKGNGLDVQQEKISQYFSVYNPIDELTFMVDDGYSATTLKRPKIQELIKMVKNNEVQEVYIHKLDRISRSVIDVYSLLKIFVEHDVTLISVMDRLDISTAAGRMIVGILAIIAQWESEIISERTADCMRSKAKDGEYPYGLPPFGYHKINKRLVIKEEEAKTLRELYDMAISGSSIPEIVDHFNQMMMNGRIWTYNIVRKILHNSIYHGTLTTRNYIIENHSPAIITKDIAELALHNLNRVSTMNKYTYLYSGKIYCFQCGCLCENSSTIKKDKVYLYYFCGQCKQRISETLISESLYDDIQGIIKLTLYDEIANLDKQIIFTQKKKETCYRKLMLNIVSVETYNELSIRLNNEIDLINEKKSQLKSLSSIEKYKGNKDLRLIILRKIHKIYVDFATKTVVNVIK